jgi:hypothetical protein
MAHLERKGIFPRIELDGAQFRSFEVSISAVLGVL